MSAKAIKTIRKVERPRPLKSSSEGTIKIPPPINAEQSLAKKPLSEFLADLDDVYVNLSNCNYDENTAAEIGKVCNALKIRGQELDITNKNLLDHYFVVFRNASREDRLDMVSRLQLLEVIELRAMGWQTNENLLSFYKRKIGELEGTEKPQLITSVAQNYVPLLQSPSQSNITAISIPLAPGEILRSSGKFAKPTKIAGKNYFKDEVVIRNSDSGKVTPGARDRLVQITGPSEEAISHAKSLVEDTIKRNASPMREKAEVIASEEIEEPTHIMPAMNLEDQQYPRKQLSHSFSMGDASIGEYSEEVTFGEDTIKLSCSSLELLKISKYVLMKHFGEQSGVYKAEQILPPHRSDVMNFEYMPKNSLQRSSWMGSVESTASVSTLDTSSEDEPFRNGNVRKHSLNEELPLQQSTVTSPPLPDNQEEVTPHISPPEPRKLVYSRDDLLKYGKSPLCNHQPDIPEDVLSSFPCFLASEKR